MDILSLLRLAKLKAATDLHLVVASPPLLRVNGSLEPVDGVAPLTGEDTNEGFLQITTPEEGNVSTAIWSLILVTPYLMSVASDVMPLSSVGLLVWLYACYPQKSQL